MDPFYFDVVTGQRVQSPDYAVASTDTPSGKLMSVQTVRVQYLSVTGQKGVPVAAPSATIKFGLKQGTVDVGNYSDTTFDVYTDAFTAPPDPTLTGAFYTATLTIDSTALRALFPVAPNGTSPGKVALIGEVLSGTVPSSTFAFSALNNVIKNTESPAVSIPGAAGYPAPAAVPINLATVTKRTGAAGDAAALANVVTVGGAVGQLFCFTEATSGNLVYFRLVTGAAATGNTDQVAPADYNAATNSVRFALVPTGGSAAAVAPYQITATSGTVTIPAGTNRAVFAASLTGNLTIVFPLSTGFPLGSEFALADVDGIRGGHTVSVLAQGTDEINGNNAGDGATPLTLPDGTCQLRYLTDGAGEWETVPQGAVPSVNGYTGALTGAQAVAGADIAPNTVTTKSLTATAEYNLDFNSNAIFHGLIRGLGNGQVDGDFATGGNLTASGTISGNEVFRAVSVSATAVVSASGSTLADRVFGCHRAAGAASITIPTLGLATNTAREFVVFDADNYSGSGNVVTVTVADTGSTLTFSAAGFLVRIRVWRQYNGAYGLSVN